MRKILVTLFACAAFLGVHAQTNQQKTPLIQANPNDPANIWMIIYKVDAVGFPSGSFSVDNANDFIEKAGSWISSNTSTYQQLLSQNSGDGIIVLKKTDYANISDVKGPEFKTWLNEMARFFRNQEATQVDQHRRYLVSTEDFNKFLDFLKK